MTRASVNVPASTPVCTQAMRAALAIFAVLFFALMASAAPVRDESFPATVRRGAYLVQASGCADCHTTDYARPLAGGLQLDAEVGGGLVLTFFTPNISPDKETGIGAWSEADFHKAMREGISPSGSFYYPVFPWRSYTKLTDGDLHDMFVYLQTLQPVKNNPPKTNIGFPVYNQRWLLSGWRTAFFRESSDEVKDLRVGRGPFRGVSTETPSWNRGAYLVESAMHCAECHSPRNLGGAPIAKKWLMGSSVPVGGRLPPNITQANLKWTRDEWIRFLSSGLAPHGRQPGAEMAQVIQNTARLTDADLAAVVEYLMKIDPVAPEGSPVQPSDRSKAAK